MERRVAQLEQQLAALVGQFLPPILERLEKLESGQVAAPAPTTKVRKRKAMTAEMYDAVKYLSEHGRTDKEISEELNIPYTTVRAYLRLPADKLAELRRKHVANVKDKASDELLQMSERATPAQPAEIPEDVSKEPAAGIRMGMEMVQEADYVELPDVLPEAPPPPPEPTLGEGNPYEVACESSPSPYGEAGYWEWSMNNKSLATNYQQADGYPFYYPVERNTILTVQYLNETIQKGIISQEVDWTIHGGVLRWKIASL